jgi:Zn-dependent alcohol dehydrogenase
MVRTTVATLTTMTGAFLAAAAVTPGVSIAAALLVAAGISAPLVHHEVREARRAARLDALTREMVRALGDSRVYERSVEGLLGIVMQKVAGHTASTNTRLDMIAETMDKAIASAFANGYIRGMAARPPDGDDDEPPRLRAV